MHRSRVGSFTLFSISLVLLGACASDPVSTNGGSGGAGGSAGTAGSTGTGSTEPTEITVGGDRATTVYVPAGIDPAKPTPLVVLLHGYGASGLLQEILFQLKPQADARGFLYAHPDGTIDADQKRFWNATDACCNFYGSTVDDVAYLSGLVAEIGKTYKIDPKQIYFLGHSNGGFMSHRMACERSDMIAAIASLAGAVYADPAKCLADKPVSVLQIHGTVDDTILYDGGKVDPNVPAYPSALGTTEFWAKRNGCMLTPMDAGKLDIEAQLAGEETTRSAYTTGCKPGGNAELWTIEGGAHIPQLGTGFAKDVIDWLFAHPKM